MKTRYKLIAIIFSFSLAIAVGYYFFSPKAIINNLSNNEYDEFVILLPTSRILFSPIRAQSSNTIFYSRQNETGTGSYSLISKDSEIARNDFPYTEGTELGRVLRFTIEANGQISVGE
jgi:hypothetical protein